MISLPNIDGLIWDLEYRTADIIKSLIENGSANVALNQEGPCADAIGLYRLLDYITGMLGVDKNKVAIHTCNQLETHNEYTIVKYPPLYVEETGIFYNNNKDNFHSKTFNSTFKTFGLFIGRSNWIRLRLASELYNNYCNNTIMTFHYNRDVDFHRPHCGVDELMNQNVELTVLDQVSKLLQASPITVDSIIEEYPMLSPAHLNIAKVYHNFFCEIVCETYFSGTSFYPTEKIWRPIMLKTPFIVHGPKNYLTNLKRLGFKTFEQWWPEGYSEDPPEYQIIEILKIIEDLSAKSTTELETMYQEMQPILEHNLNILLTLTPDSFKEVFDYDN